MVDDGRSGGRPRTGGVDDGALRSAGTTPPPVAEIPAAVPGAMPENAGHDPGDVHRAPPATGDDRKSELADFLNRVIMFEQECVGVVSQILATETDAATRDRLQRVLEDDKRAVEVCERAVRDLGGRPSAARKTAGFLAARARFVVESLPGRAREVVKARDLKAGRTVTPYARIVDWTDLHIAELAAHAHWSLLKRLSEETGDRALVDAVNECEAAADDHVEFCRRKAGEAARARFVTGRAAF